MELIIILLIIFIVWPLVKAVWAIMRQVRQVRNFMNNPGDYFRNATGQNQNATDDRYSAHAQTKKKKKISKNMGEYVDFEEINKPDDSADSANIHFRTEEQVSDAKWEDVK